MPSRGMRSRAGGKPHFERRILPKTDQRWPLSSRSLSGGNACSGGSAFVHTGKLSEDRRLWVGDILGLRWTARIAARLRRRSLRPAGAALQIEHRRFEADHVVLNGRAARRLCTQRRADQHTADHCSDQGLAGVDLAPEGAPQGRLGYRSAGLRINNNPADQLVPDRSTRQIPDQCPADPRSGQISFARSDLLRRTFCSSVIGVNNHRSRANPLAFCQPPLA